MAAAIDGFSSGLAEERRAKAVALLMLADAAWRLASALRDKGNAGPVRDGRRWVWLKLPVQNPVRGAEARPVHDDIVVRLLNGARSARSGANVSRHRQQGRSINRRPEGEQTTKDRGPSG